MKKEQTKEEYKEWLEETANKNRNNPNHSEQAFIDILDYFDIKYTFEKPVIYDSKDGYIFDFYMIIDDNEYDIEIDGKSHMDELTKLKDFKRDVQAKEHNIKVIRLDSYFVLYLRNIFKEEFTKESFLEWIINECPINLKKDMSEYKEKELELDIELDLEKDISIIQNILNKEIINNNNFGFLGEYFQYQLIKILAEDRNYFIDWNNEINPNYFTDPQLKLYLKCEQEFYKKHNYVPSYEFIQIIMFEIAHSDLEREYYEDFINRLKNTKVSNSKEIKYISSKFFRIKQLQKITNKTISND